MNEVVAETRQPLRRLRWFQWSLRGFLLFVLAFCVWLGMAVHRTRKQEAIVRKITSNPRNLVTYAHEINADGTRPTSVTPPGPDWLRRQIGDHFFFQPRMLSLLEYDDALLREAVQLPGIEIVNLANANDERLTELRNVSNLRMLDASSPYITKRGLAELARHTQLEYLSLRGAWVTDDDLKLLAPLTKLNDLNIADSQVTSEGVAWLKETWPQLAISAVRFPAGPDGAIVREQMSDVNARFDASQKGEVLGANLLGKESTDPQLLRLAAFPKLQMIYLYDTSVTAEGVRELQRLRPHVTVRPNLLGPAAEEAELVAQLERLGFTVALDDDGYVSGVAAESVDVSDEDFAVVARAKALRNVRCDSPRLTDATMAHLERTPSLVGLTLPNAEVSDAGLQRLASHKSLYGLTLRGAAITDAGLAALAHKPHLRELELREIRITSDGLRHLESCPRLRGLDLTNGQFATGCLAHFSMSTSLRHFTLEGTTVRDTDLAKLGSFPQLTGLSLRSTAVTDAGLLHLRRFPSLRTVNVEETAVTEDGVMALQRALPNCRVSR